MVHDLNPFALRIYGDFGVRWYGLSYMLGFIVAYFVIRWLSDRQRAGLNPNQVGDFVTYVALGILAGGRLGYCLFYSPDLFLKFKSTLPFWGVLAVNEGGMASHGGMIGAIVGCLLFARKYRVNSLYLFDLVAITGPIGILFGRLANFVNGELVGREAPADFAFAVKFPQDIFAWPASESGKLGALAETMQTIGISKEQWFSLVDKFRFDAAARDDIYNNLQKLVASIQDGNSAAKAAIAPLLTPRYPSQLFEAAGEGLFMFLVLFLFWRKPRKPGVVGAMFVTVYSVVRIVVEQFRMPDAHIGFQALGLTRGQWLSIGGLVVGIVLLFLWSQASSLSISGWGKGQGVKIGRR